MSEILMGWDFYRALQTIVGNLPERDVETVVIDVRADDIPRMTLTMCMRGPDGELVVQAPGTRVDSTVPLPSDVVEKAKGVIQREVRRFRIVPDDAP